MFKMGDNVAVLRSGLRDGYRDALDGVIEQRDGIMTGIVHIVNPATGNPQVKFRHVTRGTLLWWCAKEAVSFVKFDKRAISERLVELYRV